MPPTDEMIREIEAGYLKITHVVYWGVGLVLFYVVVGIVVPVSAWWLLGLLWLEISWVRDIYRCRDNFAHARLVVRFAPQFRTVLQAAGRSPQASHFPLDGPRGQVKNRLSIRAPG